MASNARTRSSAHLWEVNAILLLGVSVVLFLSFVSFVPEDISWVKAPPNSPAHNFVGPLGAWVAYLLALPFGNSVWLLFALALGFGIAFLFAGEQMGWRQAYWTALMLLSGCGLVDRLQLASDSTLAQCGYGAGGFLGQFIAGTLLGPVAPAGPYIILPTVWLISIVMLTGFRPIHTGALLLMKLQEAWAVKREQSSAASRPDLRGELVRKQRDVERQMRDLEKNGRRSAVKEEEPEPEEVTLPPQNITIRDHSLPTPTVKQATIPTATPAGEKAAAKALASAAAAPPPAMPMFEPLPEPKPAPKPAPKPKAELPPSPPPKKPEPQEVLAVSTQEPTSPAVPSPVSTPKAPTSRPAASRKPAAAPPAAPVSYKNWQLPGHDVLVQPTQASPAAQVVEDLKQSAAVLQATLADFGLDVRIGEVTKGPVITRYEIHPAPGVKVEKITTLNNNIALAMRATSVRIIAPIPGKAAVGIEVPNHTTTAVFLRDILESDTWKNTKARLPLALGKDIGGNVIIGDLADMPHLLVAGATGSGKTVCINAVITGLLFRMSPEELKFVFVDPKIVEMQMLSALPHLALPIVTDSRKVLLALRWLINEMERRYQTFAKVGVRNIHGFNTRDRKRDPKPEPAENADGEQMELSVPRDFELKIPETLPYIVLVVDELADLMMTAPADVEMCITRLAQLARATGIHMILATQRPSVNVITGVIKANVPARIAFQVASKQDSRVILDANGADKLLGKGDMLYLPPGSAKLIRAQGVYVQDEEIRLMAEFLGKQAPPSFERGITEKLVAETPAGSADGESEEDEELVEQCIEVIRQSKRASVSILQRRLRIGYTRAARIMDIIEERGIVGPHKGAEPRDILIDLDGEIPSNSEEQV
ncbi:MAG: DNA translocase FtsK [Verrucomicrobia bacterium]|nr:DNA translocase FtsK [Verrucomicrobiota bacterium]